MCPTFYGWPNRARTERFGSLKLAVDMLLQRVNKFFEHQHAVENDWDRVEEPWLLLYSLRETAARLTFTANTHRLPKGDAIEDGNCFEQA
jgi:hypothetical protein